MLGRVEVNYANYTVGLGRLLEQARLDLATTARLNNHLLLLLLLLLLIATHVARVGSGRFLYSYGLNNFFVFFVR